MAPYRINASVVEHYGVYQVRVAAMSESPGGGMILREQECYDREHAEEILKQLIDEVKQALERVGGAVAE